MREHLCNLTSPTLIDILRWRAFRQPGQLAYTFLVDGETLEANLTYCQLDERARTIGAQLKKLGATRERVLLLYPPGLEYIAAFFGCLYARAVAVPAYPPDPSRLSRTLPRLQAIVADAQVTAVLTTAPILSMAELLFNQAPELETLHWLATDQFVNCPEEWQDPHPGGDDLAFLQYTSGSVSAPRGVMLTHCNLLHNSKLIHDCFGHTQESRGVIWLPPYHDMGLIGGILQPLYGGFPVTLLSPVDFLKRPLRWLQAISRYRATTSGGPNFAYDLCVRKITPEERATLDLSSWQVAFNGAEPVRHETIERFAEAFEPCGFHKQAFYPCYGLAEATLIVTGGIKSAPPVTLTVSDAALRQNRVKVVPPAHSEAHVLVGCGSTLADQHILIVNPEAFQICPPGQPGEIWVSGPSVAQRYWNQPEKTAEVFQAYLADGQGPFLRTGDLGFMHDGELYVTGRLKDLIIIRGHNHYPQDIELTVEKSHPAFRPGCCAAFSIPVDGEERLVVVQEVGRSFVDANELIQVIRQTVAQEHELQVYAAVLLEAGSIPKTSSGKIQRHTCRVGFLSDSLQAVAKSILDTGPVETPCAPQPPAASIREALSAMNEPSDRQALLTPFLQKQVAHVLRGTPSQVDSKQPLVALGIDSLMALELQNLIEADLGVVVPTADLLAGLDIAQLTTHLLERLAIAEQEPQSPPIEHLVETENILPSFEQERLWLLDQLRPGSPAYNIPTAVRIKGRLDVSKLEQSLNEVIRRHATLRTSFVTMEGRPKPVVAPVLSLTLPVQDLSTLPETEREVETRRQAAEDTSRPFDLVRGPLVRAILLKLGDEEHVVILITHHIVSDIWSMTLMMRELAALYQVFSTGKPSPLPELPIQYADFACWQREWMQGRVLEAQLAYWQRRLAGAPSDPLLPTDRPRPAIQSHRGACQFFELSPALVTSLRELNRQEETTLFMTLLAAFVALLHRYTKREDIVVGSPTRGRIRPETEELIGFFAYPLVLRTDMSGNPTFRELLARVREVVLGAYRHQDVPFVKVMEAAQPRRRKSHNPLFQVLFGFTLSPLEGIEWPGLKLELMNVESRATDFDLFVTVVDERERLRGVWGYNTDLFNAGTMEHLVGFYRDILERCVQRPQTRLTELELPSALEAKIEAVQRREQEHIIAITATFTAEPVENCIVFWMQKLGLPFKVRFAPYNQVFQQLLDPASLLSTNENGVNVILARFEDWQRYREVAGADINSLPQVDEIERNMRDLAQAIQSAVERAATPYVVCLCPASPAAVADAHRTAFLQKMEEWLVPELGAVNGVYTVTPAELAALYPVSEYYDSHTDEMGHIPYTPQFFVALGTMISRRIYALQRVPYKVIALDCDQTLWKGVCGEDGPWGIEMDPPHQALQEFMVAQYKAGTLLCLCSKNNEEDVFRVFEHHLDMPLQREHLVAWRINWQPKSENLRGLAEELGLGLESFIFLDDNPVECAEVQARCPDVLTLQLPQQIDSIPLFLRHIWAFDHLRVTAEDQQRTTLYRQQAERERFRQAAPSLEDFLVGLDLEVRITDLAPQHLPRVAQLTQRTNQFNFTTIRRSESEIQRLCQSERMECLVVEARDRFGDYGLVGVIIFKAEPDAIEVDTFLLSCRALGRGVEHHMLARLGEIAMQRGFERVDICYTPTPKNQPALDFLDRIGASFRQSSADGWLFRFPAEFAMMIDTHMPQRGL